jgi:hypothetical protein
VKKFVYALLLVATGMVMLQVQPVFSAETKSDTNLIGSWKMTQNATDSTGKPCPFVPEVFDFSAEQTVVLSNFGSEQLPYKTTVSKEEKEILVARTPELKGKNLLLIKPNPNMGWTDTPMVYAYSISKNELTLILQGYNPAKFVKAK